MGSGVGTVVLQAALQAGCNASGIEKMAHPADIATVQLEQFAKRCRMWGVEPGEAELLTGDFTDDDRVRDRIVDADVVLCNNWAFSEKCARRVFIMFPGKDAHDIGSESIIAQSFFRYEGRCNRHFSSVLHPTQLPLIRAYSMYLLCSHLYSVFIAWSDRVPSSNSPRRRATFHKWLCFLDMWGRCLFCQYHRS